MERIMDEKDFIEADIEMERRMAAENDLIWGYDRWLENQERPKIAYHDKPPQADFSKGDRIMDKKIYCTKCNKEIDEGRAREWDGNIVCRICHLLNLLMVEYQKPPAELVPIGLYDGEELLPNCHILDDSYIVYMEVHLELQ
jgi:hypothetical protein